MADPRAHRGYVTITDPDKPLFERDTITCGHCQKIVFVKPGTACTVYLIPIRPKDEHDLEVIGRYLEEAGAFCAVCQRPICLPCHDVGTCRTWEQLIESMEKKPATPPQILDAHGRPIR